VGPNHSGIYYLIMTPFIVTFIARRGG